MKAYLVLDLSINDFAGFSRYIAEIPAHISKHARKYIVQGAPPTPVEGDWTPERMVIIEFPFRENAEAFLSKCRSGRTPRYSPPVHMIKLTQEREIEAATRSSRIWAIRQIPVRLCGIDNPEATHARRIVAQCFVHGVDISKEMVCSGYAVICRSSAGYCRYAAW